ncbi:helix-turn-helix domain-containing protein [Bacillus toyonensis]|uniref:helix-turn-helix domain-containing protein n=1 Tax=Bacillus toyonensis TaxID=155322 RepID=UPI001E5F3F08|nr:helix-turn-helix domain-containing protein [Bacillus toyonensis]MEC2351414.1 helix-turn-helix domain-containing protein [Bacillus toyonensis]MED3188826.1 helix-turn-helix domain-containing protein [Bacillus toyonensis]
MLVNKEKEILIAKNFDYSCFIFNHFFVTWNDAYKKTANDKPILLILPSSPN